MLWLDRIEVDYGPVRALNGVSLHVSPGEFVTVVGASGSGKSSLLHVIAGLLAPSRGRVWLAGDDMTEVPAHLRPVNTVFQEHRLFSFLRVAENVTFGYRESRAGAPGRDRARRDRNVAEDALAGVGLSRTGPRRPATLSRGQQQRVSLARSLTAGPRVLLLDEPFGSLDRQVRLQLRARLHALARRAGMTAVHVTHDHEEAMALGDRVVLLDAGRVLEAGPPAHVYRHPRTLRAATLLGDLAHDAIDAVAEGSADAARAAFLARPPTARTEGPHVGLRPEQFRIEPAPSDLDTAATTSGRVMLSGPRGPVVAYQVLTDTGHTVPVNEPASRRRGPIRPGTAVRLGWDPADLLLLADHAPAPPVDPPDWPAARLPVLGVVTVDPDRPEANAEWAPRTDGGAEILTW